MFTRSFARSNRLPALGALADLILLLPTAWAGERQQITTDWTVCPDGPPACDYSIIQEAVDAAAPGDTVKVATGVYTDLNVRPRQDIVSTGVVTQVVYLTKSVTIWGGYTTTNWLDPDSVANPTILDAQGEGRVFYVSGVISVTLEGLHVTGGDADGLGGGYWGETHHGGGGMYVISATITLRDNQIFSNTASSDIPYNFGSGGGLYLRHSNATLEYNAVSTNDSDYSTGSGGIYFDHSNAALQDNAIISNTYGGMGLLESAATLDSNNVSGNRWDSGLSASGSDLILNNNSFSDNSGRNGGGLYLDGCAITLTGNVVSGNYASACYDWYDGGGGIYLSFSDAIIADNIIQDNTTECQGGGIYLNDSTASISGNVIGQNQAHIYGFGFGGGLHSNSSDVTVLGNTIYSNTSSYGGGVYLAGSASAFADNRIYANSADYGGGIFISGGNPTIRANIIFDNVADDAGGGVLNYTEGTLINNIIAGNSVTSGNGGLDIRGGSLRLLHNTIAHNQGGDGIAIRVRPDYYAGGVRYSNTVLTDTILVSHTVGISVTSGNTLTVDSILWLNTPLTVSQGITAVVNLQNQYDGDPAFVDPAAGDYHIGPNSAALDRGVPTLVTTDIDGDPRSIGLAPDLGADEYLGELPCTPVIGVDLMILTPGTIYAGDTVAFQADITPDEANKPYTYTIHVDGQTVVYPMSGSDAPLPFSHTFPFTGSYIVEVGVWNCEMTEPITDTVQVTVYESGGCVPLETVTILGEIAGYLGVPYTFTLQYTPAGASLPISYTWGDGGTEAGSVRTFDLPGPHTLAVTATNCAGASVTDTHTITISAAPVCTQVESVDLSLLTPAPVYAGDTVTFSADLTPDDLTRPYTYTIHLDGTTLVYPQEGGSDPLVFSHTFPVTGVYTVEVAAWNCEMDEAGAVTDTVGVEVVERGGYTVYLPVVMK